MAAKRSVLLVVALLAASFAGGATSHWLLVVLATPPETPDPGPQPITTTQLVLVDDEGNKRAELLCQEGDGSPPSLVMYYDGEDTNEHAEITLGSTSSGYGLSISQRYHDAEREAARAAAGHTSISPDEVSTAMHIGIDGFLPAVQMESSGPIIELSHGQLARASGTARLKLGLDAEGDYGLTISDAKAQQLVRLGTSELDPELRLHDPHSDRTIQASVNRAKALLQFSGPGDAGAYLQLSDHATYFGLLGSDSRPDTYKPSLKLYSGPSWGGPAISLDGGDKRRGALTLDGLCVTSDTGTARLGIDQFGAMIELTDNEEKDTAKLGMYQFGAVIELADNGETVWPGSAAEDQRKIHEARRKTHEKLQRKDTLETQDVSLEDVFLYLAEVYDLTIQPEWPVLKASGVTPDTAVNVRVINVLLKDLFRAVLDDVEDDEPLGYFINDDGVIVITTQSEIDERTQ